MQVRMGVEKKKKGRKEVAMRAKDRDKRELLELSLSSTEGEKRKAGKMDQEKGWWKMRY